MNSDFLGNLGTFFSNPGVWVVLVVLFILYVLIFKRGFSVLGAVFAIVITLLAMWILSPLAVRAFNAGVGDSRDAWNQTCQAAGTCVGGGSSLSTSNYSTGGQSGGGANEFVGPNGSSAAVSTPAVKKVLKSNALYVWFSSLPLNPSGWVTDETIIPQGTICTTRCLEGCNVLTGWVKQKWQAVCSMPRFPEVNPIVLDGNGFFGASNVFGGKWETAIDVAGKGSWDNCPDCYVIETATPTPTIVKKNTPSSGDVIFSTPVHGYCGWTNQGGEWKLLICTKGKIDPRRISVSLEKSGFSLNSFPPHP